MYSITAKKVYLLFFLFILASLACDLSVTVTAPTSVPLPTNTMVPVSTATQVPSSPTSLPATLAVDATATALQTSFEGVEVTVNPVSVVLSPRLAAGARGLQFPRAEGQDLPYWEITPGHTVLKLEGYVLQDKFHEPQIYVYPALAYAEMVPAAFESIHRLDNILYPPGGPDLNNPLPTVPFFNAGQVFASNIQLISFQNGQGVRFLTEYAQYFAPANNHDLFYHFQGVTRDGEYYIIAIFPITAPGLAETSDAGAVVPAGGIALPNVNDPEADWEGYYGAVTNLLNSTSPEAFTPTISQLDLLIESMRISP